MPFLPLNAMQTFGSGILGNLQKQNTGFQQAVGKAKSAAESVTSPLGKVRQGMFDFVGDSDQKTFGGGGGYGLAAAQAPQMQQAQGGTGQNPQVLQMYQQMMQQIKQKRGY